VVGRDAPTSPRQVYRVIAADDSDCTTAPRSSPRDPRPATATPLPHHQFQTSDSFVHGIPASTDSGARMVSYRIPQFHTAGSSAESIPASPELGTRVVSYRIHPVRSETDFGTRSAVVYSSECRAPVGQYPVGPAASSLQARRTGGWTVGYDDDQYDSRFTYFLIFPIIRSLLI